MSEATETPPAAEPEEEKGGFQFPSTMTVLIPGPRWRRRASGASPRLVVLVFVLGQLMSNMATALIVIPIAISAADELAVSAKPVLVAVAVAAAAAFLTPVATPANLMVMECMTFCMHRQASVRNAGPARSGRAWGPLRRTRGGSRRPR